MTTPRYEVYTPTAGFILGENVLGDVLTAPVVEWLDLTDHATSVTVVRGGQATTGLSSVDVGTASAPLNDRRGALGLAEARATRPNRPARVVVDVERSGAWEWPTRSAALPKYSTSAVLTTSERFFVRSDAAGNEWSVAGAVLTRTAQLTNLLFALRTADGPYATLRIRVRSTLASALVFAFAEGDPLFPVGFPPGWTINGAPFNGSSLPLGGNVWREYTISGPVTRDLDVQIMTAGANGTTHTTQWSRIATEAHGVEVRPLFTGKSADARTDFDPDGSTMTTVTAQDAVSMLANTTRYGAVVDGGRETFRQRLERLQASSPVQFVLPPDPRKLRTYATTGDYLSTVAPGSGVNVEQLVTRSGDGFHYSTRVAPGATVTSGIYNGGVTREITGLQPGRKYRLEALGRVWRYPADWATRATRYAIGVGTTWGPGIALDHYIGESRTMFVEFTAPSTAVTIAIACAEVRTTGPGGIPDALWVDSVRLYEIDEPYRVRSVAYESSLASHLTLAADTVGAVWHPTRHNLVEFEGRSTALRFVDTIATPGDLSYTEIHMGYGTDLVVNDLAITNRGYDPETGNAADDTHAYRDLTSIATFGSRSANVDLALWTEDEAARHAMDNRSAEILADRSRRRRVPHSVTLRGSTDPDRLSAIELHDVVTVVYAGVAYTATVIGIEHAGTPTNWFITLTLDA